MFQLFRRNPLFRRLAIGQLVSFCGDWFSLLAVVTLLGVEKNESALAIALTLILKQLPNFIFAPLSGVAADKFDRQKIMVICDVIRVPLVLLLLVAAPSKTGILLLVTLCTVASAFFDPARSACLPQLVEPADLKVANAFGATLFPISMIVGASLGGMLTEYGGVQCAILIDAASFLFSAYFLSKLPALLPVDRPGLARADLTRRVSYREFLRSKVSSREHWTALLIKGLFGFGGAIYLVQMLIGSRLQIGTTGALGITATYLFRSSGALIGAIVGQRVFRDKPEFLAIQIGFLICTAAYAAVGLSREPLIFLLAIFFGHLGSCLVWMFSTIWLQKLFANDERGRAFGFDFGLNTLSTSASTFVVGYLIQKNIMTAYDGALFCSSAWIIISIALLFFKPSNRATVLTPVEASAPAEVPI